MLKWVRCSERWRCASSATGQPFRRALHGDLSGHGTACAGIVRALAPDCELVLVRVLGEQVTGTGNVRLAGLRSAIEQGFEVISLSLSTRRREFAGALYPLADRAYFGRSMLVCSAHNLLVESFPWRFASVMSVASHARAEPEVFFYNPDPPVEFFAHGVDVEVAWPGGRPARVTGNSFATPHMAGMCARVLPKQSRPDSVSASGATTRSPAPSLTTSSMVGREPTCSTEATADGTLVAGLMRSRRPPLPTRLRRRLHPAGLLRGPRRANLRLGRRGRGSAACPPATGCRRFRGALKRLGASPGQHN